MKTKTNKVSDNKEFTPGPKSLKIFEEEQKYIAPGVQSIALFSKLVMEKGEGSYFIDIDGNRYLDMYAGVGVASLGHGHPDYAKAMSEQVSKINTGSFCSPRRANYCKTLAKYTPKGLTRIQFYSGGAEAVELS
ncbi:MAG: aminotransferase class III-fold pyridoxal phosphate-dependent enzyme, partial [Elusimicrobiales bacterium]|nr:aminotransferase class III-fold pyridoxal phosphate-dependent enzyme [Elusimicrobiales bacterium]